MSLRRKVSVPLRGVGCFNPIVGDIVILKFPSPCGVWVVSAPTQYNVIVDEFPSPCGVWVVSYNDCAIQFEIWFPSPCGVWVVSYIILTETLVACFRPLAGCGLFLGYWQFKRGCESFRPLAGCGLFLLSFVLAVAISSFRPLAGCGLFPCRLMY